MKITVGEVRCDYEINSICINCGRSVSYTEMSYPQYQAMLMTNAICPACGELRAMRRELERKADYPENVTDAMVKAELERRKQAQPNLKGTV